MDGRLAASPDPQRPATGRPSGTVGLRLLDRGHDAGLDRSLRATRRQGDRLSDEQFRLEFGHSVRVRHAGGALLSDEEFSEYISALEQAGGDVRIPRSRGVRSGVRFGERVSKGERPGTTTHEGPMLDGDFGRGSPRACGTKAEQTMGSGRSWIRIDEGGGLLALTQAYHLPIEEKLGWLMHNTAIGLADFQHVEGVRYQPWRRTGLEPDGESSWRGRSESADRLSSSADFRAGDAAAPIWSGSTAVGSCSHVISCWIREAGTEEKIAGWTGR